MGRAIRKPGVRKILTQTTPNRKTVLGKRRAGADASNLANDQDGQARSSKRSKKTIHPYQTPESIASEIKASFKSIPTPKLQVSPKPTKSKTVAKPRKEAKSKASKTKKTNVPKPKQSIKKVLVWKKELPKQKTKPNKKQNKEKDVIQNEKSKKRTNKKNEKAAKVVEDGVKVVKARGKKDVDSVTPDIIKGKRRSKKEALNPKSNVTLYEKDPTFYSNLPIPHISTLAHSRLVIRAVLMNDLKLLRQLTTKDASLICTLCAPRSPLSNDCDAYTYALKRGNMEAIKILLEVDPGIEKKFGASPDLLIQAESTGHGSRHMFGHGMRAVTLGRGGKEGTAALLKDANAYNGSAIPVKHDHAPIIKAIEDGIQYSTLERLLKLFKDQESNLWRTLMSSIINATRHGHTNVAGELVSIAIKRGGHGFNHLHEQSLKHTIEPYTDFKPVSVVKKSMDNARITPLHFACINPNPYYLQTLLNSRPEYNTLDQGNWTLIHYAAVCSGDKPLQLLISRGISTTITEKEGNTPLHLAVSRGRLHNVKVILEHELKNRDTVDTEDNDEDSVPKPSDTSSLEKANKQGMRPLHVAVLKGHVEIVKTLLDAGADAEKFTPAQFDKLTPLMIACQQGHLEIVKLLINYGVKVAVGDRRGRTAIAHAVINGHADVLSYLLRIGVNHLVSDSSGNTLVHFAAAYGWYFNLKILLEAGCDAAKSNDWKMTPLAIAFMKGHIGIVEILVKQPGVDINTPVDEDTGMSLLLTACSSSKLTSSLIPRLTFLIDEHKADSAKPDFQGNNALHYLAEHHLEKENKEFNTMLKHLQEGMKFLIDRGCDLNAVNLKNETPLMVACDNGNFWIGEKLIDWGMKLTSSPDTEDGDTILHKIGKWAKSPHAKLVYDKLAKNSEILMVLKETAKIYNKAGFTPLLKVLHSFKSVDDNSTSHICNFLTFLVKKLESDVNSAVKTDKNEDSMSALHLAVQMTYSTKVFSILHTPSLVLDPLDKDLRTPLTKAILNNKFNIEFCTALIKAGADTNFKSKSDFSVGLLLLLAMKQPRLFQLVPEMIAKGADAKEINSKTKNSVLHYVARNPKESYALEAIKAIINAGADVNSLNKDGRTPLHLTVNARGNETDVAYDIEDFLISSGADLRIKDNRGRSPLHYAFVKIGKPLEKSFLDPIELVMILLSSLKSMSVAQFITMPDSYGATALHYSAMRGATICCSYFTEEMKGNLDIKDIRGNTPFGLAVWCGHEGSSLHFQQQGADFLQILDINIKVIADNKSKRSEPRQSDNDADNIDDNDMEIDVDGVEENTSESFQDHSNRNTSKFSSFHRSSSMQNCIDTEEDTQPEELVWEHKKQQEAAITKMKVETMKYPIFQEVVKKEWQGLLHLMLGKLRSSRASIAVGVSTAIRTQKLRLALKLIHRVKNAKELEQMDETLLHTLARYSKPGPQTELQIEVVKSLLEKGVDPLKLDSLSANAIIYCMMNLNYKMVAELTKSHITKQYLATAMPDKLGRTPFSSIFWNLHEYISLPLEITQWGASLLSNYPDDHHYPANILTKYPYILSPFPGVRCLVKYEKDHKDFPQYSPLIVAVIHGRYSVVSWLLRFRSHVNINFRDEKGRTPMMHAVRLNDLKMVKLLLNPHSFSQQDIAETRTETLAWTADYSKWTKGKSSDVDLNVQDKDNGWTAMDYVVCPSIEQKRNNYVFSNAEQILTILHKSGGSFTEKSGDDVSPLERAIRYNRFHIVQAMYKLANIPLQQQKDCRPHYGNTIQINSEQGLGPVIHSYSEDTKKAVDAKESKEKVKPMIHPDPLLKFEKDNALVVIDTEQDIPFDCVMTQVDLSYGMYGLYNFYKMQVVKQPRGKELVVLFTQWGRVGSEGQYQQTPFPTVEEATKEFKKIFKSKSGNNWEDIKDFKPMTKKYRLIHKELTKAKTPSDLTVDFEKLNKSEEINRPVLNTQLYNLIKQLTLVHKMNTGDGDDYSYHRFKTNLKMSPTLPIVSTEALYKADAILNKILGLLDQKHIITYGNALDYPEDVRMGIMNQIVSLSEEFYTLVPVYGFASEALEPIFELRDLLERQEEIYKLIHLGFAKEIILAAEHNFSLVNCFEYIYRCLGTKVRPIDLNNEVDNFEGQLILQYIHNNSPDTMIQGIYRVQRLEEAELSLDNRWLLWHGTKPENLLSILHSGLQIAPPGVDKMGDLFGKGIYFADTFSKSEGYTDSYRTYKGSSKFMFLCEVALGNVHNVRLDTALNNLTPTTYKTLPKGFDSCKTSDARYVPDPAATIFWKNRVIPLGKAVEQSLPKNRSYGLDYNEYIIFNPNQVKLRYLIQFS